MTQRYLETFSTGGGSPAGYDLATWVELVGAGSTVDQEFTSPAALGSPYAQCLQCAHAAGQQGAAYYILPNRLDTDRHTVLTMLTAESLADGGTAGNIYLLNNTLALPLMISAWIQVAGLLYLRFFGYGNASQVQMGADVPISVNTPYELEFTVDLPGTTYSYRVNGGTAVSQTITDGTQLVTQFGARVLGNAGTTGVSALTQVFGWSSCGVGGADPYVTNLIQHV